MEKDTLLGKLVVMTGHSAIITAPTKYGLIVEDTYASASLTEIEEESKKLRRSRYEPRQYRIRFIGGHLHDSERLFLREQFDIMEFDADEKKKRLSITSRSKQEAQ
tara:strand:- start:1286 stop:1603 length:318 start_codon:yes stop_codon:yes gene_type:complete